MSELVITAEDFLLQPLVDLRDGPAEIRWYYSRSFLTNDNIQVQWGTGTTGFWVTTPCSIASGLINVDQDTALWTTDNATDPSPASILLSAGLYSARGKLIQQLQIIQKTQWIVPVSLAPTTTWADFSIYNSAAFLANPPQVFYTAAQVDARINNSFDTHPASDTALGTVVLSVPSDNPDAPPVWGLNDPLVRDAISLEGVAISDTPPLDGQVLTYNQTNNEAEWGNQNPGTGNVISNEVSSVDGNVALASGTGGKTIEFDSSANFDGSGLLTGATVGTPATGTEIANKDYVDSAVGGAGAILANGTVPFAADESMGGFNLTDLATPDDLTDAANKDFVLQSVAAAVQQTPNISALVSGGGVLWESAYIFRVSQATYLIQGDLFSSTEQTITLDAADALLDRIDVIALDDTGTVVKITGVAAAQPSQPDVDPGTQLLLTFVFVGAATVAPANVVNEDIYIDNTEWTATTSGSGWNPNSTNNPHSGTKDIEGTNVANNAYVQLQAPSPLTLDAYALLSVFIRSKATWPKNRSLLFQWYSAGVAKGVAVTINTGFFGFDSSQIATYQLLAIPIGQFAVPSGTSLNQLRITDKGGAIGMYIDDLVLQAFGGDIGPPPTAGLTQEQADARYLQQANNLSDVVSTSTAINTILPTQSGQSGKFLSTNGTVASWQTSGAASSVPTTVQGDTLFASASNTLTALAKDTNATRYLSNTGTSNNPAWAQVALSNGISGFGTGVATALGTNVGSAGAPIVNGGALGTPASGTLSGCTGLPITTGVSGLGSNVAAFLATPSSANLATAITDETGSGLLVFATSPVFSTDITLPSSASPTTGSVAKVAFDTDAWAASRGAVQVHDGTANTFLVGVLASDTPSNGQVPTWNTGGTVTWETPSAGGGVNPTSTLMPYNNAGTFADSNLTRTSSTVTTINSGQIRGPNNNGTTPTYAFTSATNSGMYNGGTDQLFFAVNGQSPLNLFYANGSRQDVLVDTTKGTLGFGASSLSSGFYHPASGHVAVIADHDVPPTNSGTLYSPTRVLETSATNFVVNMAKGNVRGFTLNNNYTMNAPTNAQSGSILTIRIKQSAGGGNTVTWNSAYKFAGGVVPTMTAAANAIDIYTFLLDGTNAEEISTKQDVK